MLIPLKPGELQRLIPAVGTSTQFAACLGDPRKILQRLMIAAIGGVISFLIYNQAQLGSRWGPFWLLLSVVFFLYVLWGPIQEQVAATRRFADSLLQRCLGRSGRCLPQERVESRREQANKRGDLELVEPPHWLVLELADEDGYLGRVSFPVTKQHGQIRPGRVFAALCSVSE